MKSHLLKILKILKKMLAKPLETRIVMCSAREPKPQGLGNCENHIA